MIVCFWGLISISKPFWIHWSPSCGENFGRYWKQLATTSQFLSSKSYKSFELDYLPIYLVNLASVCLELADHPILSKSLLKVTNLLSRMICPIVWLIWLYQPGAMIGLAYLKLFSYSRYIWFDIILELIYLIWYYTRAAATLLFLLWHLIQV